MPKFNQTLTVQVILENVVTHMFIFGRVYMKCCTPIKCRE